MCETLPIAAAPSSAGAGPAAPPLRQAAAVNGSSFDAALDEAAAAAAPARGHRTGAGRPDAVKNGPAAAARSSKNGKADEVSASDDEGDADDQAAAAQAQIAMALAIAAPIVVPAAGHVDTAAVEETAEAPQLADTSSMALTETVAAPVANASAPVSSAAPPAAPAAVPLAPPAFDDADPRPVTVGHPLKVSTTKSLDSATHDLSANRAKRLSALEAATGIQDADAVADAAAVLNAGLPDEASQSVPELVRQLQAAAAGRPESAAATSGGTDAASASSSATGHATPARREAQAMVASLLARQEQPNAASPANAAPSAIAAAPPPADRIVVPAHVTARPDAVPADVPAEGGAEGVQGVPDIVNASGGAPDARGGKADHSGREQADTPRAPAIRTEQTAPVQAAMPTPSFARYLEPIAATAAPLTQASAAAWNVPDQIIRQMQLQWTDGTGRAALRLHPEHLGEVIVEMRVEKGGVVATLRAETPAVRAWIESHRHDLAAGLADSGLRLDELRVDSRDDAREGRRETAGEQPRRQPRRRPAETEQRFEVHA